MIEVNNLTKEKIKAGFLIKIAQEVLRKEKRNLSIALVGEKRMKELNRKYRRKNRATDVLSFAQKEIGLGEIVLCPSQIKKNSRKFSITFIKELVKVLIHGILHLQGYDHEKSEKEAKFMENKENYYLKLFFK
jgi:probable rRNA maturation factor